MIQKKCKIGIPDNGSGTDYRQRLILSIIAKTIGATTVLIAGSDIHLQCTRQQEQQVQALISKCLPELDYIIEQTILSHLHNYDLCTDEPIELKLQYA